MLQPFHCILYIFQFVYYRLLFYYLFVFYCLLWYFILFNVYFNIVFYLHLHLIACFHACCISINSLHGGLEQKQFHPGDQQSILNLNLNKQHPWPEGTGKRPPCSTGRTLTHGGWSGELQASPQQLAASHCGQLQGRREFSLSEGVGFQSPDCTWRWAQLSLASSAQPPTLAQALSLPAIWHSMYPWSPSRDWVVGAPTQDCHPPAPSEPSCRWWTYWNAGPRCSFRLRPVRSRGQRPLHQVLACKLQPQAWLQGGAPVTPFRVTWTSLLYSLSSGPLEPLLVWTVI